ncbi:MAG: PTS sugar transporter subunit IIA [Lactobacillus sp.]|jgi:PTS system mannose-specific IIA component|nr:PTS sugar transporter subunit IIA [Lactobacillus sp.]MCI2032341.1 PTS sugar transporter subunit IIA [Lactobacillus sp.]
MKILVTSHGGLCEGILESYEMLAGSTKGITALSLRSDDTGEFKQELSDWIDQQQDEPLLILCDIHGGTPYNESYRAFLKNGDRVRIVTGLNLPMLLETGLALPQGLDISKMVALALKAGREAVSAAERVAATDDVIDF